MSYDNDDEAMATDYDFERLAFEEEYRLMLANPHPWHLIALLPVLLIVCVSAFVFLT